MLPGYVAGGVVSEAGSSRGAGARGPHTDSAVQLMMMMVVATIVFIIIMK